MIRIIGYFASIRYRSLSLILYHLLVLVVKKGIIYTLIFTVLI